jgi:alpha-glucosidase (family GH31 glycosyl hydrolase)
VHELENTTRRGYQWMLGPSLLAVPLFGDDYPTAETRDVYLPQGEWIDFDTGEKHRGPTTLKSFRLPPGKTPLFVGGRGVLVLRDLAGEALHAVVYPVSEAPPDYEFTDRDGRTRSRISRANSGWNHAAMIVLDVTDNKRVPHTREAIAGAIRFPLTPGHDYRITDGRRP